MDVSFWSSSKLPRQWNQNDFWNNQISLQNTAIVSRHHPRLLDESGSLSDHWKFRRASLLSTRNEEAPRKTTRKTNTKNEANNSIPILTILAVSIGNLSKPEADNQKNTKRTHGSGESLFCGDCTQLLRQLRVAAPKFIVGRPQIWCRTPLISEAKCHPTHFPVNFPVKSPQTATQIHSKTQKYHTHSTPKHHALHFPWIFWKACALSAWAAQIRENAFVTFLHKTATKYPLNEENCWHASSHKHHAPYFTGLLKAGAIFLNFRFRGANTQTFALPFLSFLT